MVVVFPLPRVSPWDKMERGPHIGKIIKKKGMLQQKRVVGGTTCPFYFFIGFCSLFLSPFDSCSIRYIANFTIIKQ